MIYLKVLLMFQAILALDKGKIPNFDFSQTNEKELRPS